MEKKRIALTVRVDEELKLRIDMAANAENRTINNWIVNLIKERLENKTVKK
jgi:predicted HicB family RNase H-like nuclease